MVKAKELGIDFGQQNFQIPVGVKMTAFHFLVVWGLNLVPSQFPANEFYSFLNAIFNLSLVIDFTVKFNCFCSYDFL